MHPKWVNRVYLYYITQRKNVADDAPDGTTYVLPLCGLGGSGRGPVDAHERNKLGIHWLTGTLLRSCGGREKSGPYAPQAQAVGAKNRAPTRRSA